MFTDKNEWVVKIKQRLIRTKLSLRTIIVIRKMFFRLVTSVGQWKILSPHEESNLRPSDLRSDVRKVWGSIPHGDSEFFLFSSRKIIFNSLLSSKLTISIISIIVIVFDHKLFILFFPFFFFNKFYFSRYHRYDYHRYPIIYLFLPWFLEGQYLPWCLAFPVLLEVPQLLAFPFFL